ncbi:MAG: DUF5939 domain-containing protein [Pyrinomonadaceae bacterium]
MADKEFHYRWEFEMKASAGALWPYVSNTNRFNIDTGVPAVRLQNEGERRRLSLKKFGMEIKWEEQPFEWVRPFRFGVLRTYSKGPVAQMSARVEMTPREDGGTNLIYEVRAQPRNALGRIAIPLQVGVLSKHSFSKVLHRYDELALAESALPPYRQERAELSSGGRARLISLSEKLVEQGASPLIVGRLVEMIEEADDLSLARIRSHALADYWGLPRRDVLETFLWATRAGLLDLQWDVLCPMCRGANLSGSSLKEVSANTHCEACNVDYTASFDRSVELTFRPNASVRRIEVQDYCVGGPQVTPHIIAQQLLPPKALRTLALPLEHGRYRLRASKVQGGQLLEVKDEGMAVANLCARPEGWAADELCLTTMPELCLENATESEQVFILERMAWNDQATTAAEVTALQVFRDLFATEALRPGEQIRVNSLTVVFTDLRGSTRFYREIGDATAFGRVMSHFDVLRQAIADEDGALVKTIGDAVMAVFRSPVDALRAMFKAQEMLASPPAGMQPLTLKAGMHAGPCIAVTLNDRLDYFGSTVNMASRLEGLSTGRDVIISTAVRSDPEVAAMLAQEENGLTAERFEMMLKGFDEEQFELWRIARRDEG